MTVVIVMELPSMTVIIVMKLHSMTVVIVMPKRPRNGHIHRRHGNSYVVLLCVDFVYEGLRNYCAYAWVVGMLRTHGVYECCLHLVCCGIVYSWRIMTVIIAITHECMTVIIVMASSSMTVIIVMGRVGLRLDDGRNRHA